MSGRRLGVLCGALGLPLATTAAEGDQCIMHTVTLSPEAERGHFSVDVPTDLGSGFVEDHRERSEDEERSTTARFEHCATGRSTHAILSRVSWEETYEAPVDPAGLVQEAINSPQTFTSRGEEGIREALSQLQTEFRKTGKQPVHRNVFGRLYEWLASSETVKDPGDIRRIVREHMFDMIEMAAGSTILGGTLPERRLHSVASLANESGLYPTTLRNVLIARGLISREGAHHVFDASAGRDVAASVCDMVHVNSLHKALNCSRH